MSALALPNPTTPPALVRVTAVKTELPGLVIISTWGTAPVAAGDILTSGPGLAMGFDDAESLAKLILSQVAQARAMLSTSGKAN